MPSTKPVPEMSGTPSTALALGAGEKPKPKDPFLEALDEEFKNLEDYLRSKESQEIKKKQ